MAVEFATEEARNLKHNFVGTEHLLLGLLRVQEGVAAQVLTRLGLKLEEVREEIVNLLSPKKKKREELDLLDLSVDESPELTELVVPNKKAPKTKVRAKLKCKIFSVFGHSSLSECLDAETKMNLFLKGNIEVDSIHQSSTSKQTHITIFYRNK
jgi:ATP-dependent Clp protease ATP-binding subunit ClpA